MNRSRAAIMALVMAALAGVLGTAKAPVALAAAGSLTTHHFSAGPGPARDYLLYTPPSGGTGRPVVVFLHGCTQTAVEAAVETRFDDLADEAGFLVVYPEQLADPAQSWPVGNGNGTGCWNWFLPEDQQRDEGEPATIAGITREVVAITGADPDRVYIDGISAGADMAVIVAATYPDLFAAGAAVAGCPFATCSDATGAVAYRAMGPRARTVPMLIAQGTADTLNAFPLGQALVQQWLGTDDLADNGAADGTVARTPASTHTYGLDQAPQPGSGDACIRNRHFPCPGGIAGFQGTYPYTIEQFAGADGCDLLDFWIIHGLEHAYPDADPDSPFSDPLGPDLTTATYRFFASHPMHGGCVPVGSST